MSDSIWFTYASTSHSWLCTSEHAKDRRISPV
jgi:hypothetical protein